MTTTTRTPRADTRQAGSDRRTLSGRSFHLIGIGGAGMSVVAQLLAARGARVSGSDAHGGPAFDHLADLGIATHLGHDATHLPAESTVVVSTAIKETNPELAEARRRGQEVIHRSQALALAAQGLDFVAVAGAHGKTTTSGMLAEALTDTGADPSSTPRPASRSSPTSSPTTSTATAPPGPSRRPSSTSPTAWSPRGC